MYPVPIPYYRFKGNHLTIPSGMEILKNVVEYLLILIACG